MKSYLTRFKKGYHRPVSMPIWKWIIVMLIWAISVLFYCASLVISSWLLIVAIFFQLLVFCITLLMDTGSWRDSQEGKDYIEEYETNKRCN